MGEGAEKVRRKYGESRVNLAHTINRQRSGLAEASGLWEGALRDGQGGAVYSDWTCGLNVPAGKTYYDNTYVSVGNNRALSASISGYELTNYDW